MILPGTFGYHRRCPPILRAPAVSTSVGGKRSHSSEFGVSYRLRCAMVAFGKTMIRNDDKLLCISRTYVSVRVIRSACALRITLPTRSCKGTMLAISFGRTIFSSFVLRSPVCPCLSASTAPTSASFPLTVSSCFTCPFVCAVSLLLRPVCESGCIAVASAGNC